MKLTADKLEEQLLSYDRRQLPKKRWVIKKSDPDSVQLEKEERKTKNFQRW